MSPLILKRAKVSRPSGQWRDDDHDVLKKWRRSGADIFLSRAAPEHRP
jgi:hypothetical protein